LWKAGPWDLPNPGKIKALPSSQPAQPVKKPGVPNLGTDTIIAKNLFDPERGMSKTKEAEADVRAMQRIKSIVLLGTAIIGPNRYAVVQESDGSPAGATQNRMQTARRLRVGDMVEGFNLSEINEKAIVFVKGASRVELPVDFFRKVDLPRPTPGIPPQAGAPAPVTPGQAAPAQVNPAQPPPTAVPNITRRPRLPGQASP
jgi:hypothetical protein